MNTNSWTEVANASSSELRALASTVTVQGRVALAELTRREAAEAQLERNNRAARATRRLV